MVGMGPGKFERGKAAERMADDARLAGIVRGEGRGDVGNDAIDGAGLEVGPGSSPPNPLTWTR